VRLISLCPSLTETVFDLERGADLVGRTRYCVEPAGEVDAVEEVGGTKDPDLDRVAALAPDLVLLNEEENRLEDYEVLRAAGIACHASFPRTPACVPPLLRDLGERLAAAALGEALARRVEDALTTWEGAGQGSFAYLCWRKPWMAAGPDTFVSALLEAAGGSNVLSGGGERYPVLDARTLGELDPGHVLLSSEPFPFEARHADELAAATGLPRARFELVDGRLLSWHGSSTGEGISYAARCLRADAGAVGSG
jgi:iron complex transport system substrate-binding protein